MALPTLVRSSQGLMVGDYSSADVIPSGHYAGHAISAFAVGQVGKTLTQPMYVPTHGLEIGGGALRRVKPTKALILRAKKQGFTRQPNVPPRG
jgi:hypothetical protein